MMERTIVTEPYVPGSIGRAMRLHLWLGWLAVYLTCFWVGQAVMSLAPSDPGLAVVDAEYVTWAGYASVSSTMPA